MSYDSTIHAKAVDLAKLGFEMTAAAGSGHPTSAASLAHIVTVLMYDHMRYEPANPAHPSSDRLVLSEGHAVPILYAACADQGVMIGHDRDSWRAMTRDDAKTLRELDSMIDGHPNPAEGFPFFDAATGSLGQGLSVAAGIAAAARADEIDRRIYCIVGDGEAREGQNWEAIDFIKDHDLKAVCPIFNANVFAQSDVVSPQQTSESLAHKLEAASFEVLMIDGHNPTEIKIALEKHTAAQSNDGAAPIAIVARTVKGWGTPSAQGNGHHGQAAKGDALAKALEELDATGRQLGAASDTSIKLGLLPAKKPEAPVIKDAPSFTDAMKQFGKSGDLEKGKFATRKAYGVALRALGQAHSGVFALDADVRGSTFADMFAKDDALAPRFLECRIAEQNMVSVAAGLSAGNKIPFCSTFGKFFTRAYDQIEMAVNSGANFKLIGSHAGISLGADGPSQMAMPDVAWFRSLSTARNRKFDPLMYVLQPSDAFQAYALMMEMAKHPGPCYMRTLRPDTEFLYGDNDTFTLGGHEVLIEGQDLLIIAAGYMVHEANRAIEKLDEQGVDATVVDLYSLPFDEDAILDLANENNGMILTIEDNYGGGIGSAVADAVAADGGGFTVKQMFVRHTPKSGKTEDDMMKAAGLSADDIVREAMLMLEPSMA